MNLTTAVGLLSVLFMLTSSPLSRAEEIIIGVAQQASELAGIERPVNGQSREEVMQQYGPPQEMTGPAGDPPISRWTYQNFSVYFEYNRVLHTVLHHQPALNPAQ